jgi:hypothetical protein
MFMPEEAAFCQVFREKCGLERDAFLYIRQSSPRQVMKNTESTKRQYALGQSAVTLGWPLERIHVIDSDLGHSASEVNRTRPSARPRHSRKRHPATLECKV